MSQLDMFPDQELMRIHEASPLGSTDYVLSLHKDEKTYSVKQVRYNVAGDEILDEFELIRGATLPQLERVAKLISLKFKGDAP